MSPFASVERMLCLPSQVQRECCLFLRKCRENVMSPFASVGRMLSFPSQVYRPGISFKNAKMFPPARGGIKGGIIYKNNLSRQALNPSVIHLFICNMR